MGWLLSGDFGPAGGNEQPHLRWARKPNRLPVVMTREEVEAVLAELEGEAQRVCTLLAGQLACCARRFPELPIGYNDLFPPSSPR